MKIKPYILDDRCIISEEVKKMSKEERQREREHLETEGRRERERLQRKRKDMCNMKERKLSESQEKKIAEIKKEWIAEVNKLDIPYRHNCLSCTASRPYRDLERKYKKMIQEVIKNGE